jgi:hypothetical protein
VDDAYLMLHSWQRLSASTAVHQNQDLKWRVAEMLGDVGPSITITSLTNVGSLVNKVAK